MTNELRKVALEVAISVNAVEMLFIEACKNDDAVMIEMIINNPELMTEKHFEDRVEFARVTGEVVVAMQSGDINVIMEKMAAAAALFETCDKSDDDNAKSEKPTVSLHLH